MIRNEIFINATSIKYILTISTRLQHTYVYYGVVKWQFDIGTHIKLCNEKVEW